MSRIDSASAEIENRVQVRCTAMDGKAAIPPLIEDLSSQADCLEFLIHTVHAKPRTRIQPPHHSQSSRPALSSVPVQRASRPTPASCDNLPWELNRQKPFGGGKYSIYGLEERRASTLYPALATVGVKEDGVVCEDEQCHRISFFPAGRRKRLEP